MTKLVFDMLQLTIDFNNNMDELKSSLLIRPVLITNN